MNFKITYNWLCDFLDTDATPTDLQKYLSLCGPSIERIEKCGDDYVFEIEVTSNRIDSASVFGIAQEAVAILPQFGKKACLKLDPLQEYRFSNLSFLESKQKRLNISITDNKLIPRFTALVFSPINIKPAPQYIQTRLRLCSINTINNVVDISNYLMLSLGQPIHMFDYDKIRGQKMIVRESRAGEIIVTLDGKKIVLPGGDIVIEDGEKRLIDLCGIMGGKNSAIDNSTKTIIFFVQTYNPNRIRRTSMLTGQRTIAASYFEKGLDIHRVETAFVAGVKLITKLTGGKPASPIYDIYSLNEQKNNEVVIYLSDIQRLIGVAIDQNEVLAILQRLGFVVEISEDEEFAYPDSIRFAVRVPSYRSYDIQVKEDIIEEVARIYGYHNLPCELPPPVYLKQPSDIAALFSYQNNLKYFLKHLGLNEVMNYSMISKRLIEALELDKSRFLRLANTISAEIEYLRDSLLPSLINNIAKNQGKQEPLKFFEIAKVYLPQIDNLPDERHRLGIATTTDFFDLKGIIEAVLRELNITNIEFSRGDDKIFAPNLQAKITADNKHLGYLGQLNTHLQLKMQINLPIFLAEIDLAQLISLSKLIRPYQPPYLYAIIKLDLTIKKPSLSYAKMRKIAFQTSPLLIDFSLISIYKDNLTIRMQFSLRERNITEEEAKIEFEKIRKKLLTSG